MQLLKKDILVIIGPTASSKSDIAIDIAKKLDGEIISADSMQIYKGLNIGTAKASKSQRKEVKHYMVDICKIKENFSVADFKRKTQEAIDKIYKKNKTPIIVGGTGLYINAIVNDMVFLDKTNCQQSLWNKNSEKYKFYIVYIDIPRDVLYDRINKRIDLMDKRLLLKEAKKVFSLQNRNKTQKYTCVQAIGYKEFFLYFKGLMSFEEAIDKLKQNTRNYAKRQITWFKKLENKNVVEFNKSKEEIIDIIIRGYNEQKTNVEK